MTHPYFWSDEDEEKLKNAYLTGGLNKAHEAFPDLKRGTVATKASRLKLTNPRPRLNKLGQNVQSNGDSSED